MSLTDEQKAKQLVEEARKQALEQEQLRREAEDRRLHQEQRRKLKKRRIAKQKMWQARKKQVREDIELLSKKYLEELELEEEASLTPSPTSMVTLRRGGLPVSPYHEGKGFAGGKWRGLSKSNDEENQEVAPSPDQAEEEEEETAPPLKRPI